MLYPQPKDFQDSKNYMFVNNFEFHVNFVMNQELGGFCEEFQYNIKF